MRQFVRARHSFSQLQSILSKMKVSETKFPSEITKLGTTNMFDYMFTTDKQNQRDDIKRNDLKVWNSLRSYETKLLDNRLPSNGFQEAINLTEQGRLWKYPIDNEDGLDEEKQVPFEEHVFLEKHLEGFPEDQSIQTFMGFVLCGLANNPYMTVERKVNEIQFYKKYFDSKREIYKQAGLEI